MADVNKPKLQLRSGLTINGDKNPSPTTKLLINHGKPNFTIPRAHKTHNGYAKSPSPTPTPTPPAATTAKLQNNNNHELVVKSTTFNGVLKPSSFSSSTASKQTLPINGNVTIGNRNANNESNEAAKVVLRRAKVEQAEMREREDDENVPEFIRRQRRIQERLANQNILDFENRRSGYFTQVMISPSSPNRKSFVETMASPAVKPGLEMPAPATQQENHKIEATAEEQAETEEQIQQDQQLQQAEIESNEGTIAEQIEQEEEEEVAKAIEEVNKAVEGEDDDKTEPEDHRKESLTETKEDEHAAATVTAFKVEEGEEKEPEPKKDENQSEEKVATEISTEGPEQLSCASETTKEQTLQENEPGVEVTSSTVSIEPIKSNGHAEEITHENDLARAEESQNDVTISHVNGFNGPSIPAPDPSGEKGVNYETKTVVSFSQELGNGDNKYPDTVKVTVKDNETSSADSELKELTKLKFEIKADNQDIEVKPVLLNETS